MPAHPASAPAQPLQLAKPPAAMTTTVAAASAQQRRLSTAPSSSSEAAQDLDSDTALLESAPLHPALPADAAQPTASRAAVRAPFSAAHPAVQSLIMAALGLYTASNDAELDKVLRRFAPDCEFHPPFLSCSGTDRVRIVVKLLLQSTYDRIVPTPTIVGMRMLSPGVSRVDVEGSLRFHPRARHVPLLGSLLPQSYTLHVTWTIVAASGAANNRIVSFGDAIHNLPAPPCLLRRLLGAIITRVGLAVSRWLSG